MAVQVHAAGCKDCGAGSAAAQEPCRFEIGAGGNRVLLILIQAAVRVSTDRKSAGQKHGARKRRQPRARYGAQAQDTGAAAAGVPVCH